MEQKNNILQSMIDLGMKIRELMWEQMEVSENNDRLFGIGLNMTNKLKHTLLNFEDNLQECAAFA